MLSPDYLARCTSTLLGMYDVIDQMVMADIARRIVKTKMVTETGRYEIGYIMRHSSRLIQEIQEQLTTLTGYTTEEIGRIFRDACLLSLANDARHIGKASPGLSPAMLQLMRAQAAKTAGDVANLTRTLGITASGIYQQACTKAELMTESGAFTYDAAIRRAIIQTAHDGNYVTYPSGHRDHIDVAIRRATLTGTAQTTGKITETYAEENGVEYYEVTAHAGARPSHAEWQGQVYKIHGSDSEYENFVEATGYGSGEGLCGYNCRHSFFPFVPGVSKRAYTQDDIDGYSEKKYEYDGEKYNEYEIQQMMRAHEREIRAEKRILIAQQSALEATTDETLAAGLRADFKDTSKELRRRRDNYKEFCKAVKHKPDNTRTQVHAIQTPDGKIAGFGRSIAQKARRAAVK